MLRSAAVSTKPVAAAKRSGTLYIVARGGSSTGEFSLRYQHGDVVSAASRARSIGTAFELLDFIEALGLELSSPRVRSALSELYFCGSASISGVWLTDQEASLRGLI